jgi:hypothetical protein
MPHACITTKPPGSTPTPPAQTHICEDPTPGTKTLCGETVEQADPGPLKHCAPTNHGPTHKQCGDKCHAKHPELPRKAGPG